MVLDTRIPLMGNPAPDPAESMGRMLSLKALMDQGEVRALQSQQMRDTMDRTRKLRDLYSGMPADATEEQRVSLLRNAGFVPEADAFQKSVLDRDKTKAETGKLQGETQYKALEGAIKQRKAINDGLSGLLANPKVTHDDVINTFAALAKQGVITDEMATAGIRSLPGDPAALRPFLMTRAMEGVDEAKRLEALTPQFKTVDLGGRVVSYDSNAITNPNGPGSWAKTATPGELLTDARARERLAFDKDKANQDKWKPQYDSERGVFVDPKTGAATPIRMVDGSSMQPKAVFEAEQKNSRAANNALGVIKEAEDILKSGQATGSYVGAGVDLAAQAFGKTTPGALATGKLKALEGALMMAQPRMEGPQSDKDVALYRQMAAEIGDPTVPAARKLAALETVKALHARYATPATQAPTAALPQAGRMEDGYVYMGGDPASPSSWKKVR